MTTIATGTQVGVAEPALWFGYQHQGVLTDVDVLDFQIRDATGAAVYPTPGDLNDWESVDLVANKLGEGRYAPTWTATAGATRIVWRYQALGSGVDVFGSQDFEVLDSVVVPGGPLYATVKSIRDAGIDATQLSDQLALLKIATWSQWLERVTGQHFEPRASQYRIDGTDARSVLLWVPICGISRVVFFDDPDRNPRSIDLTDLRVYNRHLSQRLTQPDDRNDPKIDFRDESASGYHYAHPSRRHLHSVFHPHVFPWGPQAISVDGVFGYTDWVDGMTLGKTPDLIAHAVSLLAQRDAGGAGSSCNVIQKDDWRVVEEKTRDQTVKYSAPLKWGQWTGDAEIDQIIYMFMRPVMMGAV